MNEFGLIAAIAALIFTLLMTGALLGAGDADPPVIFGFGAGIAVFLGIFLGLMLYHDLNPDTYYLPCEVIAANDDCTYFGTVDSDSREIYAVETGDHIWPDDVPYLLHMDSKGTVDTKDDEVLVVWRTD